MSEEEFVFFTPSQLIESRQHAIKINKERVVREFTELFKKITQEVQTEINTKLLAATTSTWEQLDATQCSLRFSANELILKRLTEEQRDMIVSYYSFNAHMNIDDKLYDNVVSTLSDKLTKINYFQCDLLIPIAFKLADIGYKIEWDLYPNAWGFIVNWKLI
jgi:hypothetical protein